MIKYSHDEEKLVALYFASEIGDSLAASIIENGEVTSKEEAIYLSKFFWLMVNRSAEGNVELPCAGGSEFWTEKLYNSIGGYLERAGFEEQWNQEIDNA